jgi:hypothetical protein
MQFLLLVYGHEAAELALTADERRSIVERHQAFTRELVAAGKMLGGDALTPGSQAAVVRRGGSVTDGPFAETKEQLGGYYVVECADRDEAIEIARRVPESPGSLVEVRPLEGM